MLRVIANKVGASARKHFGKLALLAMLAASSAQAQVTNATSMLSLANTTWTGVESFIWGVVALSIIVGIIYKIRKGR